MTEFDGIDKFLEKANKEHMAQFDRVSELILPLNLSHHEVKTIPSDELEKILNGESSREGNLYPPMANIIIHELSIRQQEKSRKEIIEEIRNSTKPHWSTVPNFWLIVLTLIATVVLGLLALKS